MALTPRSRLLTLLALVALSWAVVLLAGWGLWWLLALLPGHVLCSVPLALCVTLVLRECARWLVRGRATDP